MRGLRILLWAVVLLALFGLGAISAGLIGTGALPWQRQASGIAAGAPLGGAFQLVDAKGAPVTEEVLRSEPSAVFFGYTHCPDVCPTTLMDMTNWIKALGPDADRMRFVFVTVDPERDTPAVMNDYVSAFSDKIIGVSGPPDKVHAMVTDYKIVSRKVPLAGGDYTMDHTASVLLLDRTGSLVSTISRDDTPDAALVKLKRLVAG